MQTVTDCLCRRAQWTRGESANLKAEWDHSKASLSFQLEFRRTVRQPSLLCDLLKRTGRRPASGLPSCAVLAPQNRPGWRCLSGRSPGSEWRAASWTEARGARTTGWTPPPADEAQFSQTSPFSTLGCNLWSAEWDVRTADPNTMYWLTFRHIHGKAKETQIWRNNNNNNKKKNLAV